MDPKQRAGQAAVALISDGMTVGLGSGSTARFFIQALADTLTSDKLRGVQGVPTSRASESLAIELGIPLTDFSKIKTLDITVDGADEVGPGLNLIKGLGGALLREKMVAQNSRRLVIIVDSSKRVTALGTKCPLPVEVTTFGHEASERFLRSLGCQPILRQNRDNSLFLTDNGNYIYDCRFPRIDNPADLAAKLADRAGIVEIGLFIGMADLCIMADENEVQTLAK